MSNTSVPAVPLPPPVQAVLLRRDPIGRLTRWAHRLGPVFTLQLPSTGPVVILDRVYTPAAEDLANKRLYAAGDDALGASWQTIGHATGMTLQSVHECWRQRPTKTRARC